MSLLPAINLCQISELSLVLLTLGKAAGDVSETAVSVAALAFAFLAIDSTYAIVKNDQILRKTSPWLARVGLPDRVSGDAVAEPHAPAARIFLLGFSWTASSLLAELTQRRPDLVPSIRVVDFNPQAIEGLRRRGVDVVYGDIGQRDVLVHAGVGEAEVIICTVPDLLLKGSTNLRLLRQLRELNPKAKIFVHAQKVDQIRALYAAGADYVIAPRLLEAEHLVQLLAAAEKNLLDQKRKTQARHLDDRDEVLA